MLTFLNERRRCACLVMFSLLSAHCLAFGQQAAPEQWSKIAIGFANPVDGESRIDDARPFAISFVKADESAVLRQRGKDSVMWHFDADRVLENLGIEHPTPQIRQLAQKLGGVLTMESIIRTIEVYGFDELSPEVPLFFKHEPDIAKPYVASIQYIVDATEANEPSSGELWLAEMEFDKMSFSEQVVDVLVSSAMNAARSRATIGMIVQEFQKVVSAQRRDAWKEIREEIGKRGQSVTTKSADFSISIEVKAGEEQTKLLVRNASDRVLNDVTIIIENREDVSITGQNIQTWNSKKGYYLLLPVSHRLSRNLPLSPNKQRTATPFRVSIVDASGVVMDGYLTQRPGSRLSIVQVGVEEVILEHYPLTSSPSSISKILRATILDHNRFLVDITKGIRTQQSKMMKAKKRLSQEQLELLETDIARLKEGQLPKTLFPWVASELITRSEMLANQLEQYRALSESLEYSTLAAEIQTCLELVESGKLLAPMPIPEETSDEDVSKVALKARGNLETLIRIAESKLNSIEKRLLAQAIKSKSDQTIGAAMYKIGELRFEAKLPSETTESEIAYLKDLAVKFENSLSQLETSLASSDKQGRRALDEAAFEYEQRYGKLLSSR